MQSMAILSLTTLFSRSSLIFYWFFYFSLIFYWRPCSREAAQPSPSSHCRFPWAGPSCHKHHSKDLLRHHHHHNFVHLPRGSTQSMLMELPCSSSIRLTWGSSSHHSGVSSYNHIIKLQSRWQTWCWRHPPSRRRGGISSQERWGAWARPSSSWDGPRGPSAKNFPCNFCNPLISLC